ncbi:MAG: NusG domain II-containing protein [Candidatus Atribacteria bacterium]|nr:NusG domain II-containing protein [Candidatus Atribacteria bacterium]
MKPSWNNRLLILILFGIALIGMLAFFLFRSKTIGSYRLIIKDANGQREIVVNDRTDSVLFIEGPLGNTEVKIHQGKVWVIDSPCADKVCIHMGKIPDNGGFIACLPNRVIIRALLDKNNK